MIILTGNSLSERQRELNSIVNEAATTGVSFDKVRSQNEKTDIDRLFKIDLANKYRNIDYIIETLKCGDSVYITRALKCQWLYHEDLSHIVNPDYLEQHVFPEMSFKMKRKFLKLLSQHMNNSDRAALFCSYCIKVKLPNIALKFLWYAPESYKVEVIKGHRIFISDEDMINIIGDSFTLATTVLNEGNEYNVCNLLKRLRYLYSVSDAQYLDLVEKYLLKYKLTWPSRERFGLRLSKNIIRNHKNRLLCHTELYLNMLNKKSLIKYNSADDVKKYVENMRFTIFWDFYDEYKYILEVIPLKDRLQYLKEVFKKHYPKSEFEMNIEFYEARLDKLMTKAERESWALEHVKAGLEHFGHGQDFKWYKFVSFDKAFEPLIKYILVAANNDVRTDIVNVLVSSAQSDRELETLFNYYYKRFVNEMIRYKEKFIDKVLSTHSYHKFDETCWQAFNKILHSMDVYDSKNAYSCKAEYKITAIVYAIIHKIELHDALKQHIDDGLNLYLFKQHTDKLAAENVEIVYNYIINYYLQKINHFNIEAYDEDAKFGVRKYIHSLLELMIKYDKPKSDIPVIVMKFVALDHEEYKYNGLIREEEEVPFTQFVLLKDLKRDSSLVASKVTLLKHKLESGMKFNFVLPLRKLKLYFSTDIALKYVELFNTLLSSNELCEATYDAAVYGLFHLAEYADKLDLVSKYVPTESKIDHVAIERKILYIRKAICKFMCLSRPIIPLSETQKYVVGDYLKFCLPMLQSYAANLQPPGLREFIKFLLNSPVSIQKHGVRLAFQCFSVHDLKTILTDIWKKTKNVSLRLVIYKEIYQKIVDEHSEDLQKELFESLKAFTLDVREDDDDELFTEMNRTQLPSHVLGDHILCTWNVLNMLPDKKIMITRKSVVLKNMGAHLGLMQQDVVESIVCEHITNTFQDGQMKVEEESHMKKFCVTKWNLTAKYLMHLPSQEVLERKLKIVETLVKECIKFWKSTEANENVFRAFLICFIEMLGCRICYTESTDCLHGIVLLKQVLKDLLVLPLVEIYDTIWYLRLSVIAANTIVAGRRSPVDQGDSNNFVAFEQYIDSFAKEFTKLLNEFIEENNCYTFAFETIIKLLSKFSAKLISNWPYQVRTGEQYIFSVISSRLVEIEKYETYKFALLLLSTNGNETQEFCKTLDKIKSFNNNNLKYYFYKKIEAYNIYT